MMLATQIIIKVSFSLRMETIQPIRNIDELAQGSQLMCMKGTDRRLVATVVSSYHKIRWAMNLG